MIGGLFSWMSGTPRTVDPPPTEADPTATASPVAAPDAEPVAAPATPTPASGGAAASAADASSPSPPKPASGLAPKAARSPPVVKVADEHVVTTPPKAPAAESTSPARVGSYGSDNFMQQHVRKVSAQMTPTKEYTGIKAQVGADSFMLAHVAKTAQIRNQDNSGPHRTMAGAPNKVGAESFMMTHTKNVRAKASRPALPEKSAGSDAFMAQFVKKTRDQSPKRERDKMAGSAKPHLTSESLQVRVTKPGPHPIHGMHQRGSQGVRSHIGNDSFMMNHLQKIAGWSSQRDRPKEVRI